MIARSLAKVLRLLGGTGVFAHLPELNPNIMSHIDLADALGWIPGSLAFNEISNSAAGTTLANFTIPADGVYEVFASGSAVTLQAAARRINFQVRDEQPGALMSFNDYVLLVASKTNFPLLRLWLKNGWELRIFQQTATGVGETLAGSIHARQLYQN
jgi:hypothetical protein